MEGEEKNMKKVEGMRGLGEGKESNNRERGDEREQ